MELYQEIVIIGKALYTCHNCIPRRGLLLKRSSINSPI
jgi:hypothetical protein